MVERESRDAQRGPQRSGSERSWQSRRRDFLLRLGIGMCGITGLGVVKAVLSYMRPRALMELPTSVVLCRRDRVTDGTVLFDKSAKVILVGTSRGLYAMSAVCPHLGCMTSYRSETRLIECACHGSAFTLEGTPLYGPSSSLHWLEVEVNRRNEVVVDTAAIVQTGRMHEG